MEIFKQLFDGLEKEIKKEIMSDMKNEAYKLKADLSFKTSHLYNELDSIKFENANLLEKKMQFSTLRWEKWEQKLTKATTKKSTEIVRLGNWNKQYSRKNDKI